MAAGTLPSGTVTLVFTDIEGSTKLLQEIGTDYGEVLAEHHRLLREVWPRFDGVEVDTEGDAFFVAFPTPSGAVTAVEAAQRALAGHEWPGGHRVHVRMGVHTGEPQQRGGTYWGIDVHYAARLCSAAHGDQVLLSAATRALAPDAAVEDLGEHAVKDFPVARPIFHLVIDGRGSAAFPPPRTLEAARTNLPSISTPLVGREAELEELERRLTGGDRLITLVGAGGTGKTRVGIAAGARLLDRFPDGVFLVGLAPVSDPSGVPAALAEALAVARQRELGPEAAVREHLRDAEMLLVIDNFEHVLEAAPFVGQLLDRSPGLCLLVTSQAPLRLAAESVLPLEPLGLPGEERDLERLAETPAVALFVERAQAADPAFALTASNAPAVAALCRRLDGLPLGLELAAARVRMAGVDGLLSALERGADALGRGRRDMPERQRGLRAALDWTVSLLEPEQRELFAGLGVFADAWTIEQAERIFGAELDLWEGMAALLDFSLVRTRGDGRLTMAERVKAHARELLADSGREDELRAHHAELMAEIGERLTIELLLDISAVIARTRDGLEEFEQAISWSRRTDPVLHRRLLAAVGRPFYFVARLPSVMDEIESLLTAEHGQDAVSGRLFVAGAMVSFLRGEVDQASRWTGPAVECHRRTADVESLVSTMSTHAHMLTLFGDGPAARECIAEALELSAGFSDRRVRDQLEGTIAFAAVAEGNFVEAEQRLRAMVAAPERTDFAGRAATSYLADCALAQGKGELALEYYAQSLVSLRGTDVNNSVLQLIGIAASLAWLHRDADAALVLGAVERSSADLGISSPDMLEITGSAEAIAGVEERLGAEEWERQRARGRELDLDHATDVALALAGVGAPATR